MANSIRDQVINSITAAMLASTGIITATNDLRNWYDYDPHEFPVVTVLDRDTDIQRLCFKSTTNADKIGMMNVVIRGYVQDTNNVTKLKRTNLIRDIQKKMEAGTSTMNSLIFDFHDDTIETDDGLIDGYSVFDLSYTVKYHYNHLVP